MKFTLKFFFAGDDNAAPVLTFSGLTLPEARAMAAKMTRDGVIIQCFREVEL